MTLEQRIEKALDLSVSLIDLFAKMNDCHNPSDGKFCSVCLIQKWQ
jgi:hypothetical protein